MNASKCTIVESSDLVNVTLDARLVGLRWDLIPWSLVFDLDSPIAEGMPVIMKRSWLCFHRVGDITLPWEKVRLPTGCWLTSTIQRFEKPDGFSDFSIAGLFSQFECNEVVLPKKVREIVISARNVAAVASLRTAEKGEYGLDRDVRQGLASDEELLEKLEMALPD